MLTGIPCSGVTLQSRSILSAQGCAPTSASAEDGEVAAFAIEFFIFFSLELACTTCCRPGQEQEPARAAPNSPNTHPAPEAVSQSEIWGE